MPEIAASTGSACHTGDDAPSPVLAALGADAAAARGAVRFSLGRATTEEDVARARDHRRRRNLRSVAGASRQLGRVTSAEPAQQ